MTDATDAADDTDRVDTSHLDGVEDGCGCAEVWEHLSDGRESGTDAETGADVETEEGATVAGAGDP